jgi:hypothetical protein
MELARQHLTRHPRRLAAYNMFQIRLMSCFIRRGGSKEAWVARYAVPFRRRYGWMLASGG